MKLSFSFVAVFVLAFANLVKAQDDIVSVLIDAGLNTLVQSAAAADLVDILLAPTPSKTVFAPTDFAFASSLSESFIAFLQRPEGKDVLNQILLYHVLSRELSLADLVVVEEVPTVSGDSITITEEDGVLVNNATIIAPDVPASNGVIHVIDEVLIPPSLPISKDAVDFAVSSDDFSVLAAAVTNAGLVDTLTGEGPFTVFAPTNNAVADLFGTLSTGTTEFVLSSVDLLSDILLYHVVVGEQLFSGDLTDGADLTTAAGQDITVSINGESIRINEANVISADNFAQNGVIHVINAVLLPPDFTIPRDIIATGLANEPFSTLIIALQAADLADEFSYPNGPFTIFAPINEAFEALLDDLLGLLLLPENLPTLSDILLYHIVVFKRILSTDLADGDELRTLLGETVAVSVGTETRINDARIIAPDVLAINGVIHGIDSVLLPPGVPLPKPLVDIVDTAIAAGFDGLVLAVVFAELEDELRAPAPRKTVFAPTDEAFGNLPAELLNFLLTEDGKSVLEEILLFHVLGEELFSSDLVDGITAPSLFGENVTVTVNGDSILVEGSKVIQANIRATNGVIHVIDAVLIPSTLTVLLPPGIPLPEPTTPGPTGVPVPGPTVVPVPGPTGVPLPEPTGVPAPGPTGVPVPGPTGVPLPEPTGVPAPVPTAVPPTEPPVVVVPTPEPSMPTKGPVNIVDLAVRVGLSTLATSIDLANLGEVLRNEGPFTVFAPTNEAFVALFQSLPGGATEFILNNSEILGSILLYHVTNGNVLSQNLSNGQNIVTLEGSDVTVGITADYGLITVNDVTVVAADNIASNGVVHVIDGVLVPPSFVIPQDIVGTAVASDSFSTLVAALRAASLVDAVAYPNGPFTVFAPTNDAFAALPTGVLELLLVPENVQTLTDILLYHVVNGSILSTDLVDGQSVPTLQGGSVAVSVGSSVLINDSVVILPDILTTNGVIHGIDAVLLPEGIELPRPVVDIVETAAFAGFDTLVAAVGFAELVGALSAAEPRKTVFAPTNDAFAALPQQVLDFLLTEEGKESLVEVLLYHVVGEELFAADFVDGTSVQTLLGEDVTVTVSGDSITVEASNVIQADVVATNGVIHVIDAVLIPDTLRLPEDIIGVASKLFSTLVAAVAAAGLTDTLKSPGPFTLFAPTDFAFEALFESFEPEALDFLLTNPDVLSGILLYHVIPGRMFVDDFLNGLPMTTAAGTDVTIQRSAEQGLTVNQSRVIAGDFVAVNGVIHALDAVLIPPDFVPPQDLVDTAIAAGFDVLVTAVANAGLGDTLKSSGPFTVFAPTDDAFDELPLGVLRLLLQPENLSILADILLYHVISGEFSSDNFSNGQRIGTAFGSTVEITIIPPTDDDDGTGSSSGSSIILVNDATVVAADIRAINGIIHAVDAILKPPLVNLPGGN